MERNKSTFAQIMRTLACISKAHGKAKGIEIVDIIHSPKVNAEALVKGHIAESLYLGIYSRFRADKWLDLHFLEAFSLDVGFYGERRLKRIDGFR